MRKVVWLWIVWGLFSAPAFSQSSYRIPISDPIYRVLDQLLAFELVDTPLYGVRPWSAREINTQLAVAEARWQAKLALPLPEDSFSHAAIEVKRRARLHELWKEVDAYYQRWGAPNKQASYRVDVIKAVHADMDYTDTAAHPFAQNGLGPLPATLQSLGEYQQGRPLARGADYKIETAHAFQLSPYLSGYLQPYFYFQFPHGDVTDSGSESQASWHELYGRSVWHNVALQVGRSSLVLGQGEHGGLLLTDHARPLDGIQLMNDEPFRLPWLLRYLGKTRLLFHIATLGPDYSFRHSLFSGIKLQLQPTRFLELGLGHATIFGGEGAPDFTSFAKGLQSYFGFIPLVSSTSGDPANRIVALDLRVTSQRLRGAQVYAEAAFDDKTTASLKRTLVDTSAYLAGVYLPRASDAGLLDVRVEGSFLSELFYRHGAFPYVQNGQLLGMPMGPDSILLNVTLGYAVSPSLRLVNRWRAAASESNQYTNTGNAITVTQNGPKEIFLTWQPRVELALTPEARLHLEGAYQRVLNAAYANGRDENQFLAAVGFSLALPELSVSMP